MGMSSCTKYCSAPLPCCATMHCRALFCAALCVLAHARATGSTCAAEPILQPLGCHACCAFNVLLPYAAQACGCVPNCAAEPARAALHCAAAAPLFGSAVLLRPAVPCCSTVLPCAALCWYTWANLGCLARAVVLSCVLYCTGIHLRNTM